MFINISKNLTPPTKWPYLTRNDHDIHKIEFTLYEVALTRDKSLTMHTELYIIIADDKWVRYNIRKLHGRSAI